MAIARGFESAGTATARATIGTARACGSESNDPPAGSAECAAASCGATNTVHTWMHASRVYQNEHHNLHAADSVQCMHDAFNPERRRPTMCGMLVSTAASAGAASIQRASFTVCRMVSGARSHTNRMHA